MARKKSTPGESKQRTEEDKQAAFQKLAVARVNKALKAIRQLKYLANPSAYVYNAEQVLLIQTALTSAVQEVDAAFRDPKAAKSEGFVL